MFDSTKRVVYVMLALSRQRQIDKASPQNKLISLFLEAWNRQGAEFDVIDSAASRDGYGLFCRPEEERTRDETRHSRTPPRLLTRTSLALDQTKTDYPRNARQAPPSTSLLTDMTPPPAAPSFIGHIRPKASRVPISRPSVGASCHSSEWVWWVSLGWIWPRWKTRTVEFGTP